MSLSDVELEPAPIKSDWILEGKPHARNRLIFKSDDGTSWTMIWDCTAGLFNWFYLYDETVHVLEGKVVVTTATGSRTIAAGDAIFFPAGSSATWHVDSYVRKIAFLRQVLPPPAAWGLRAWMRVAAAVARTRSVKISLTLGILALRFDITENLSCWGDLCT
jgi:uncharacterized cupin superfamily protein